MFFVAKRTLTCLDRTTLGKMNFRHFIVTCPGGGGGEDEERGTSVADAAAQLWRGFPGPCWPVW